MGNHTKVFLGVPVLLAVALLSVSCDESVAPSRPGVRPPALLPALDVVGDQSNGTFGANGTQILKGFNPTNPHLGDAIIATFFWMGSSNIITSVTDHLTDGTPVGNTYSLVEYVTGGGISMATFVATDVRNFPDPNPDQNKVLVVQANLSTSITNGGILLSAYSGVQSAYAQALGGHHSASGSSSSITPARPGAIAVNAGALAYGVTFANSAVGVERPAGFTNISTLSDASRTADGEYAVQMSAGSVDPQWTWYFNSPSTWLATVIALNPAETGPVNQPPTAAFTSSCSGLSCTFTNTSSDADGSIAGSQWSFGDGATSTAQSPSHTYASGGTYTVTLTVTDNAGATASTSRSVTVSPSNQPPTAGFTASCSGLACTFTNTSTDPDGSITAATWTFGDGSTSSAHNASHTYAAGGTYTVTLQVTDNAGATNSTSKSVTVTAPNQPPMVDAGKDETVLTGLLYTLRASFSDPDNDGPWSYTIDWGDGSTTTGSAAGQGSISAGHNYVILLPRSFTVTVTVRDGHGASSSDTKVITVLLL